MTTKFKIGDIVIITGSIAELRGLSCNRIFVTGYVGKVTGFSISGEPKIDHFNANIVRSRWIKLAPFTQTELYKALNGGNDEI
jgi:hypothetical protein